MHKNAPHSTTGAGAVDRDRNGAKAAALLAKVALGVASFLVPQRPPRGAITGSNEVKEKKNAYAKKKKKKRIQGVPLMLSPARCVLPVLRIYLPSFRSGSCAVLRHLVWLPVLGEAFSLPRTKYNSCSSCHLGHTQFFRFVPTCQSETIQCQYNAIQYKVYACTQNELQTIRKSINLSLYCIVSDVVALSKNTQHKHTHTCVCAFCCGTRVVLCIHQVRQPCPQNKDTDRTMTMGTKSLHKKVGPKTSRLVVALRFLLIVALARPKTLY